LLEGVLQHIRLVGGRAQVQEEPTDTGTGKGGHTVGMQKEKG
jgi:hypothetical protein